MAWDLSADREREQMESLRNAWLEREEVILNHLRVSAAMFRWGYRILGIIAALVVATAIMFLGGMLALMIKLLPWLLLAIAVVWVIKAIKAPKVPKYQRYDRWRY